MIAINIESVCLSANKYFQGYRDRVMDDRLINLPSKIVPEIGYADRRQNDV